MNEEAIVMMDILILSNENDSNTNFDTISKAFTIGGAMRHATRINNTNSFFSGTIDQIVGTNRSNSWHQ